MKESIKMMFNKDNLKPGHKFYFSRNEPYHIVTSFIDNESELFVIKSWNKYKQRWSYEIVSRYCLEDWFDMHNNYGKK